MNSIFIIERRLIDFLHNFDMSIVKETGFEYPGELRTLYMPECVSYRTAFNLRMRSFLANRVEQGNIEERFYFSDIAGRSNLLIPDEKVFAGISMPFDVINISGVLNGKAFMFVENWGFNSDKRLSSGKSSLMMELLGLEIDYNGLEIEKIRANMSRLNRLDQTRNFDIKLLCSDMVYVGAKEGFLVSCPIVGEQLIAQWDIARHVSRILYPEWNNPERRREQWQTDYLERIGRANCFSQDIFADNLRSYDVRNIFVINKINLSSRESVIVKEKESSSAELESVLGNNPSYNFQHTDFWKINLGEHDKRLSAILGEIDEKKIPRIYRVDIATDKWREGLREAADRIFDLLKEP